MTGSEETWLNGIFYISRNTTFKYSSHSGLLMPNCRDAKFTSIITNSVTQLTLLVFVMVFFNSCNIRDKVYIRGQPRGGSSSNNIWSYPQVGVRFQPRGGSSSILWSYPQVGVRGQPRGGNSKSSHISFVKIKVNQKSAQ